MRTSILLDDQLGEQLKRQARRRGMSLSAFLAEAGRAALRAGSTSHQKPFELITYEGSGARKGINLDQTSELLAAEDQARYGK